jgi:caffeoyl-CoA O-methyltransferase
MDRRQLLIGMTAAGLVGQLNLSHSQQQGAVELHRSNPPVAEREGEPKILAVLDRMLKSHETYLSVPIQDGKALRLLTEATGAKNVVEIGTSTGYSGLWLCLALQRTRGRLTTFEIDHQRASMAQEHFNEAGVEKRLPSSKVMLTSK